VNSYGIFMPRQARLDAPGTLHHVMGRGIEGTKIFKFIHKQRNLERKAAGIKAVRL
jgi:hypothetical protein